MIYLDDGFFDHRKVIAAGDDAAILYMKLLGWLKQQRSDDGRIPAHVVPRHPVIINGKAVNQVPLVARLVEHGLWERDAAGFVCHGYTERNEKAIRKSKQAASAARKRYADADASALRTQERTQGDGDADAGAYIHNPQPQPQPHPPGVAKSSSSSKPCGPLAAIEEDAMPKVEAAAQAHAERVLKAQPPGSVHDAGAWKAKAAEKWKAEHGARCRRLLAECPDWSALDLLRRIEAPALPGYRIQPPVELPTIDGNERAASEPARAEARAAVRR